MDTAHIMPLTLIAQTSILYGSRVLDYQNLKFCATWFWNIQEKKVHITRQNTSFFKLTMFALNLLLKLCTRPHTATPTTKGLYTRTYMLHYLSQDN